MAKDKITFYIDWKWLFKPLSNEEKGLLIDAIFKYCETGKKVIETRSESLQMAFGYISEEIARDKERRKSISKTRRIAGLRSANARKAKQLSHERA